MHVPYLPNHKGACNNKWAMIYSRRCAAGLIKEPFWLWKYLINIGSGLTMKTQAHFHVGYRYRQIASWLYGAYTWALFIVILVICGGIIAILHRPATGRRVARAGARLLLRLTAMPVTVHGLKRLPRQPHILVVNHSSFLDGIVLTALLPAAPGYAFVVRQQFNRQHWFCSLLHGLGTVVLNRDNAQAHAGTNIDKLVSALEHEENLLLFPEGGYGPESGLRDFHSGAFVAAAKAKVPVVIAALSGTREALRSRTWLPRRVPMTLEIGATVSPNTIEPDNIANLTVQARDAMLKLLSAGI